MKTNAFTALACLVVTLSSGAALAGTLTTWAFADEYNQTTSILTGVKSNALEKLHVTAGTNWDMVDNPDLIPDPSCRKIATQWNIGRLQNRGSDYFGSLLGQLATGGCKVEYARSDVANTKGEFDLKAIRPTP